MKKISETTSYKLIFIIALAVLILLLIPMIAVANCMVMTGDDYSFSTATHNAIQNGGSLIGAAIEKTKEVYFSWQGSFVAVFLMSLQPGLFGYQYYSLTTIIMLAALCGGVFYFSREFFAGIFEGNKYGAAFVGVVIAIFATQFLPSAYQGFYWYNSSVYYTFFFGIELVTIALLLSYCRKGKKINALVSAILAFIIGGGNYVTALLAAVILSLAIILMIIKKDQKYKTFALILGVLLISFLISAFAPGNSVRQAENPDHPGPIDAVLMSLYNGDYLIRQWANLPFAAMIVILGPVLWDMAQKSSKKFELPGLVTLISYFVFSSMLCPHMYAMGSPGPGRVMNIIYFAFLILSAINVFWWMGWIQRKLNYNSKTYLLNCEIVTGIIACVLIVIAVKIPNNPAQLTSVTALSELRSGEAYGYYKENEDRFEILENNTGEDVELSHLNNMPILLFSEDMKSDPDNYMNRDAANYFGVNSIVVK